MPVPFNFPKESNARVYLKPGPQKILSSGRRMWVYRTEIHRIEGDFEPGDTVQVYDAYDRFVAKGFINTRSMLTVRLLTHDPDQAIDEEFWRRRVIQAWNYRRLVMPQLDAVRVVFSEADGLPGVIVDKFGEVLVVQILSLGAERWKPVILRTLDDIFLPMDIVERNDVPVRDLEGLPQYRRSVKGRPDLEVVIPEGSLEFRVDVMNGQKTGFFLDQRENRIAVTDFTRGARVLDVFSHTGGFACHAAAGGAREVTAVEISGSAVELGRENARRNGLDGKINWVEANAFDYLRQATDNNEVFDVVILDPPAFAKNHRALDSAYRGYKEINLRAMKLLAPGGVLVTSSCSQPVDNQAFEEMLLDAAQDAGRRVRVVERRGAGRDHPVVLGAEAGNYLKCFFLHVE